MDMRKIQEEIKLKQREYDRLKIKEKEMLRDKENHERKLKAATNDVERARQQLAKEEKQHTQIEQDFEKFRVELAETQARLGDYEKSITDLRAQFEKMEREISIKK